MAQTSTGGGAAGRPLSPHLQIWKWHVTMATSIAHRASGVGNALGGLLLAWWLLSAASGEASYEVFAGFISSLLGQLILFGFTASLVYHALNGIRHLFWDTGAGFDLATSRNSGLFVFAATAVVTVLIWVAAYSVKGGA